MSSYAELKREIWELCLDGEINALNSILYPESTILSASTNDIEENTVLKSILYFSGLQTFVGVKHLNRQTFVFLLNNVHIYNNIYIDLIHIPDVYYLQALCAHPRRPATIDSICPNSKVTALALAFHKRRLTHITTLLHARADPNVNGISGDPLIMEVTTNFTLNIVDEFLSAILALYGFDYVRTYVNSQDKDGCSALHYALSHWTPTTLKLAKLLISFGANLLLANNKDITPADNFRRGPMLSQYDYLKDSL